MKLKRLFIGLTIAALIITTIPVSASVLGSSKINGYSAPLGEGTEFFHNLFFSDQSGVGKQSENYIVYSPNSTVIPIITAGTALFGASTVSSEVSRLNDLGTYIIGGSNADFFSFQTGVPMSNAIVDGKILTKDISGQDAIGFLPDGSAFISYFSINSVLTKEDGSEVSIHNINKFRQPYAIYLMTDDFSDSTQNTTKGIDVVLNVIEGEMKLGSEISAVVESVNQEEGSAPIPKGKIVLTVDEKAPSEFFEPMSTLQIGEKVTIKFSVNGDERWNDVAFGMGSIGGRLLADGKVNENLEKGAAPRTAIGITADGSIVLYTIDGRQTNHSYGVQLKTLAERMKELGCTDAINLDGGGSTEMMVTLPGEDSAVIINKPSDSRERKVSTFFFFTNTAKKTGKAESLHLYPKTNFVLTGASTKLTVKATDSGYYPASLPKKVTFSVQEGKESTISQDGTFSAKDNGTVTVYAADGNIETSLTITCLETPTDIVIKNKESGEQVKSLSISPETKIPLAAEAYGGYNKLVAENKNFTWEADSNIGEISENGVFLASDKFGASGNIKITAGKKTVTIPVTLASPDKTDEKAYPVIDITTESGEFFAEFKNPYDLDIEKDQIKVKIDGIPTEFEFDSEANTARGTLPEGAGKITVFATNVLGYTSFKTLASKYTSATSPFSDTSGHWAEGLLGYMYNAKIISGDPTSGTLKFNPQKPMTRSEFAVMMTNFLGVDKESYKDTRLPYSDLDQIPFWAVESFKALYAQGILKGRYISETESVADPLSTITRAEAATIVARALPDGFLVRNIDFVDRADIPDWAKSGIDTLISLGAMNGYEDQSLKPLNTLTKAEAAKILYSIM